MRALTISQPFASLIASGEKWVENRVWATDYRGELAIHAGKGTQYCNRRELSKYPTGCVIAVADLVACVYHHAVENRDPGPCDRLLMAGVDPQVFLDHEHTEGPWCWVLRNVRRVGPIPARGAQGLWEWERPDVDIMAEDSMPAPRPMGRPGMLF